MSIFEEIDIDGTMPTTKRPICPKCGMNMIALSATRQDKRVFECLRCGHAEESQAIITSPPSGRG